MALLSPTLLLTGSPKGVSTFKVLMRNVTCNIGDTLYSTISISPKPILTLTKSNDINGVVGSFKDSSSKFGFQSFLNVMCGTGSLARLG